MEPPGLFLPRLSLYFMCMCLYIRQGYPLWRKGNPPALLVGMQAGAATLENSRRFLKKLTIELPYDPAIALPGIYPKDTNVVI